MKILYVYEKMPSTYQQYLLSLLTNIKLSLDVKTLTYQWDNRADYVVKSYKFLDNFQRILFFLKLTKFKTVDLFFFNKHDIIHIQHSFLFNKIIPLLNQKIRPKIIITLRGGDTYIKPWVDKRWSDFYKNEAKQIDAFITVSQNQKDYLLKWGINEKKIHVIPVSFGDKSDAKPKKPNKCSLKIVSAFRMTWEKNIEASIQFAKILKDRNIDFKYDIYGDGKDLGQLFYLIDKYNLSENVFVKGKIDNNLLKSKLVNYDFFLQLSVSEALSVSVIEAQSLGVPCIVSDSGGLKEAVCDKKTAIVASYTELEKIVDNCISLWEDEKNYFEFSRQSIEYANKNFSTQIEAENLKELYKKIIN